MALIALLLVAANTGSARAAISDSGSESSQQSGQLYWCAWTNASDKINSQTLSSDANLYGCNTLVPWLRVMIDLQAYDPYNETWVNNGGHDDVACAYCVQLPRHAMGWQSGLSAGSYRWLFQYWIVWPSGSLPANTYMSKTHGPYTMP